MKTNFTKSFKAKSGGFEWKLISPKVLKQSPEILIENKFHQEF